MQVSRSYIKVIQARCGGAPTMTGILGVRKGMMDQGVYKVYYRGGC